MAKKTTKKKAPKPASKKKAPSKKTKKSTKKKVVKKPAAKKVAKKAAKKSAAKKTTKKSTAKKSAPKKKTAKKPTTKKAATKSKATTKKSAPKKTTKKKSTKKAASPADNGKATEAPKPVPSTIRRVVRPNPIQPPEPAFEDWTPLSDAKLRKVKTGLSKKDLDEFKRLLMEKRAEIVGDVLNMEESRAGGNGGDLSNMPLHMADIGSDNYEQEFTLGLVESERKLLIEIDGALLRLKNKTYGVCIVTGTPIPPARLEIKPWAKYSIEVVRQREKLGLHSF